MIITMTSTYCLTLTVSVSYQKLPPPGNHPYKGKLPVQTVLFWNGRPVKEQHQDRTMVSRNPFKGKSKEVHKRVLEG